MYFVKVGICKNGMQLFRAWIDEIKIVFHNSLVSFRFYFRDIVLLELRSV